MNQKKTSPRVNLIAIMVITAAFVFLSLHLVSGQADILFTGLASLIALICTALVTQGDTDKEVPLTTHLAIMSLRRPTGGDSPPPSNPFRTNLLFGFGLLCAAALFVLWKTAIMPEIVIGAVFPLAVVLAKKLSDPGANDKTVPEEVTLAEIGMLAEEWEDASTPSGGAS